MAKGGKKSVRQQNYAKLRAAGYSREEARRLDKGGPVKTRERAETKKRQTRAENYRRMIDAGVPRTIARQHERSSTYRINQFLASYKPNAQDLIKDNITRTLDNKRSQLYRQMGRGTLSLKEYDQAVKELAYAREQLKHKQDHGPKSLSKGVYKELRRILEKYFPNQDMSELYGYPSISEVA